MEKLVSLCKNRGFVYPGSEIYGGLANSWDYGPLGAELKENVKRAWKKPIECNCGQCPGSFWRRDGVEKDSGNL